jgi:hypothetical protein
MVSDNALLPAAPLISVVVPVLSGAVFRFTRVPFAEPVDIVVVFFI